MTTTTNVDQIKLNIMTQEQYNSATISPTELYAITDAQVIADKLGSSTVGSTTQPIYLNSGVPTVTSYSLAKSVPADAVFTDTTYSVFTGANGSSAGTTGLVKQPAATDNTKFLKGDCTWATPTDTKNTAGSTDTSSKIFLVGATSQAANPQTYSHDTVFVDTSGRLNSAAPASSASDTTVATTAWVAGKGYLTSHQTIKINGITGATSNNYGTCSTAAGTAEKAVTLTAGTFNLETGARVVVKFTVTNTASNPTLKVGSATAKAIQYRGAAITAGYLAANRSYEFVYDGTNFQLIGDVNTDTDTKTAQNISTTNNTYPMLLGYTANATANIGNQPALFGSGIKANPSTSQIVANSYAFGANATMQYNSNTEAIEFVFS